MSTILQPLPRTAMPADLLQNYRDRVAETMKKLALPSPVWTGHIFHANTSRTADGRYRIKGLINSRGFVFLLKCGGSAGKAARNALAAEGIRLINN